MKVFPHNHCHELEQNLLPPRCYGVCVPIHVNLSFPTYNHKIWLRTKQKSNLVFLSWTELCLFLISRLLVARFHAVMQLTHIDQCTFVDQRDLPFAVT